jgi:hypothetical protein
MFIFVIKKQIMINGNKEYYCSQKKLDNDFQPYSHQISNKSTINQQNKMFLKLLFYDFLNS